MDVNHRQTRKKVISFQEVINSLDDYIILQDTGTGFLYINV